MNLHIDPVAIISVVGSLISILSFFYAFYIGKKTKKLQNSLMSLHIQKDFTRSKSTILKNLTISYRLIKDNNIIDQVNIEESLIELNVYQKILSTETTKNIKRLRRDIEKSHKVKTGSEDTKKNRAYRKIMSRLYELISTLEKDFNEKDKYLEVIVK